MKSFAVSFALIAAFMVSLGACSDPVSPSEPGIPTGIYRYERSFMDGGVRMWHSSQIVLASQLQGYVYDTLYREEGGVRVADSVGALTLIFQAIGNGYHRTIGVGTHSDALPDTVLGYWRFSYRDDSLYTYIGRCYSGGGLGIIGRWELLASDTALLGGHYTLDFRNDSVGIEGHVPGVGDVSGRFLYQARLDTLRVFDAPVDLGDRYSVTPGWWLYLTTRPDHGYARVR